MATTNETRTNLADRLLARVDNARRIGTGSRMFRRFGVENPYAGGSVSDTSRGEGLFSFLSSRAYFDELRGLSRMRRHLMWRIASVRHQARVGERMHQNIATRAVRASVFGSPTFIDWGSQIDLEEEQDEAPVVKRRRRPKARRVTAAERALRADVARASDVLAKLGEVFDTMRVVGDRSTTNETRAISRLPLAKQAGAARRIVRKLRGTAAAAARGTELGLGVESVGQRPLAVAQARQADDRPSKGLRRVLQDSPIVMTLERPEAVAPVPAEPAFEREVRRPRVRRAHAHRRVPVATVAREARNQASVGRAGPPKASTPIRSEPPRVAPRPTERIARVATQVARTPFADVRRGLDAAGRTSPVRSISAHGRSFAFSPTSSHTPGASAAPASTRQGPAERVASRAAAGLPDDGGRLTAITSYVGEHPSYVGEHPSYVGEHPSYVGEHPQQSERRVSVAPEMALPSPVVPDVSTDSEQASSVSPPARPFRRRKTRVRPSKRTVRGSLPPMARAVQRTVPWSTPGIPMPLAAAPVASSEGIDRRAFAARPVAAIARRAEVAPALPSMLLAQVSQPDAVEEAIESNATTESKGATARTRPSSQRALASRRPSRRARALPTVRAAARALAQERTGARGRMLSPSSSAHVRVSNARDALAPALRIESGRIRPVFRSTVASGASIGGQAGAAQSVASSRASRGLPLPELESLATPEVDAMEPAPEVARLGPVARASRRSRRRERVTSTGSLVTEKPVAAFSTSQLPTRRPTLAERVLAQASAGEASSSTPAARLTSTPAARLTSTPAVRLISTRSVTGTIGGAPAGAPKAEAKRSVVPPVTQVLAQPSRPASAPEVLRDPPRRGLAARATDRTPRRQRIRRSMLPATTPERQRSERARAKAQLTRAQDEASKLQRTIVSKSRAGEIASSRALRGVASRAGISESSRTPASQTEISKGLRTPDQETRGSRTVRTLAGWTERTLASRTLPGFTVRSEAFHTGKSQTEFSVTHRTGARDLERSSLYRAGRRLDAVATLQHDAEVDELPLPLEGGISRAVRRSIPSRASVSDSPVTYLASTPEAPDPFEAGGVAGVRHRRARVARPVSRAVARSMPRRTAGSVVPHPATTDRAAQATTRMLGAAPGAYAAHEGVVLAGTEAVEYRDPVRSRLLAAATRATAATHPTAAGARTAPQTSRAGTDRRQARSMEGPEDGMIFATPAPPPEATTIAGGSRSVGPRPGTRSRSRMARALRVATASVAAGQRSSETVLTLPASRRIAEGTATAPRVFEARLEMDSRGRVVRSAIADSTGGPSLLGAVPPATEAATSTEWAETREDVLDTERSTRARSNRSRVTLAADGRSFVPTRPSGTAGSATRNPHLGLGRTLDALSGGQKSPRGRNKPLLRRRAWARRGMAAELGVLAPVLADADYVEGPTVPGDAPSWARRAVIGTSGVAAPQAEAPVGETQGAQQRHTTKPGGVQKREVRRPNSLSSALARADSPADLVKIILERSDETNTLRKELPARAARMVERIANMPDELAEVLQSGRRTYDTPVAQGLERNVLVPYRSSGVSGPTQLSGAKDGVGANRMMKLADKLRGLIHLAENSRKAAQDNVRMSTEAPSDLSSEGGSGGGGLSVDGHKFGDFEEAVNIIRRSVEDAESDRKERAGETPEGSSPYGT